MRNIIFFLLLLPTLTFAQAEPLRIVDEKPVLRSCLQVMDLLQREQCTNQGILTFIYQNVAYPDSALQQGLEGMVVVEVIIGKSGNVIGGKLVKDIGGGCGPAVVQALQGLHAVKDLWVPAVVDNLPVDYIMTIPVKFNIPEPPPPPLLYQIFGADTIYHEYSTAPEYVSEGGMKNLLQEQLKFPTAYQDSCLAGTIDVQVIIGAVGQLQIVEVTDYENLGIDFQFELIQLLNSTDRKWKSGTYNGKEVNVIHNINAVFLPTGSGCQSLANDFAAANNKVEMGAGKYAKGDLEAALLLWEAAIASFPENSSFRLIRGQTLLENNRDAAQCCEDLTIAKRNIKLPPLLAGTLPIICKQAKTEGATTETPEEGKN